eukprot:tig00021234_g19414.t1
MHPQTAAILLFGLGGFGVALLPPHVLYRSAAPLPAPGGSKRGPNAPRRSEAPLRFAIRPLGLLFPSVERFYGGLSKTARDLLPCAVGVLSIFVFVLVISLGPSIVSGEDSPAVKRARRQRQQAAAVAVEESEARAAGEPGYRAAASRRAAAVPDSYDSSSSSDY